MNHKRLDVPGGRWHTPRAIADVVGAAGLPVTGALPSLRVALAGSGAAVLVAPPGTGKTTLVPLALADDTDGAAGRVVVAEPRRVAVRAAAARMAYLLGEPVGERVGYAVRGERRTGPDVRVEVVTTGLLVARLLRDPDLPGVDAVVLDECHERHLDTDLALAFAVDARAVLRPDLRLVATSATVAAGPVAAALGGGTEDAGSAGGAAPVVEARDPGHPVDLVWAPPSRPVLPPQGLRVDPALLDHVAVVTRRALDATDGDVLVVLPGRGEIEAVERRLGLRPRGGSEVGGSEVVVRALHGGQDAAHQDAVLAAPEPGVRRVVLATAIAESSLTVPGVRAVVDAGLSRVPRTDHARGLDALVTVAASRASAAQRAGRAGREAPGVAFRCWSEAEHAHRDAQPEPDVARADLTGFALALARWGTPDGEGLALPDRPPAAALTAARTVLRDLGAVDDAGRVTARGTAIAASGVHPRLGRALLDGAARVGVRRATEVVALLALDRPPGSGDDLVARWQTARRERPEAWRAEVRRLRGALPGSRGQDQGSHGARGSDDSADGDGADLDDDAAAGLVVALAHPDRLARRREGAEESVPESGAAGAPREYLLTGGTGAELAASSALRGSEWLAVADAERRPGERVARIRLAVPVGAELAREAAAGVWRREEIVAWEDGDVVAEERELLGAVVLARRPLRTPDPARVADAVRDGMAVEGLDLLAWDDAATGLRARMAFLATALGAPWPQVDDETLRRRLDEWLGPDLARVRRRADLRHIRVAPALRRLLPWAQAARLDDLAPTTVAVPGGRTVRVDYSDPAAPVVALRVQQAFGWRAAPTVAGVPVVVHLLSPAGRPVAVTADLASFWTGPYAQVRAELRGRYPKHAWPADPTGDAT